MIAMNEGYDLRGAAVDRAQRLQRARIYVATERGARKRDKFAVLRELLDDRGRDARDLDEPHARIRERQR